MHDFTLVSWKMIKVDYNLFDKHFCFFHNVGLCLKINRSDLSFAVHKFEKSNLQWNALFCKENLFHTSIHRESKQLLRTRKSRRGCTFFILHLPIYRRNDNVEWLAAFFKKLFRHNECFRNTPSKQMNSFDHLCRIILMSNR